MAVTPSRASRMLLISALSLVPAGMGAQQSPAITLKPTNGTLAETFTNIQGIHELSDGRVLTTDSPVRMVLADFGSGHAATVSDVTWGMMTLFPGDTTVLTAMQPQWVFLVGTHPVGMLARDNPVVAAAPYIVGVDSLGHVLTTTGPPPNAGDSASVVLVSRATAQIDTVALIWTGVRRVISAGEPIPSAASQVTAFPVSEMAAITIDGWIAVIRKDPYRVDWRLPDGTWRHGAPLPVPAIPLDDREKHAFLIRYPNFPGPITNWPDVVPPFSSRSGHPLVLPDGNLLLLRTPTADFPDPRYDMIDRHGQLIGRLQMPPNSTIAGFGSKSVYVMVKDGTVEHLERHPWP